MFVVARPAENTALANLGHDGGATVAHTASTGARLHHVGRVHGATVAGTVLSGRVDVVKVENVGARAALCATTRLDASDHIP
mgnify:CR=1 FL=1